MPTNCSKITNAPKYFSIYIFMQISFKLNFCFFSNKTTNMLRQLLNINRVRVLVKENSEPTHSLLFLTTKPV